MSELLHGHAPLQRMLHLGHLRWYAVPLLVLAVTVCAAEVLVAQFPDFSLCSVIFMGSIC